MPPSNAKQTPTPVIFVLGLFFGVIVGVFLTLALSSRGTTETFEEARGKTAQPRTATPPPAQPRQPAGPPRVFRPGRG